ncbi:MAG: ABC transporter permease [Gemmatimonadaceae bacterium]|nr:ABC transporter permease [Gemmatimonadaceae bacterium]
MTAFLLRRILMGVATVFAVTTLTFVLLHAAPGEPYAAILEDARFDPAQRAAFRERHGLDDPVPLQYVKYLGRVARGDLGESFVSRRPVISVIAERLPRTLLLMGTALALGAALGVAVGAWQANREGSPGDRATGALTVALTSVPDFWIAIALLLTLGLELRWFPITGMTDAAMHDFMSPLGKVGDIAYHLVLPALSLVLIVGAVVARFQRSAVLEVLPEDYVRTARAKGVAPRQLLYRHALRNALLPTITLIGLSLPALVGGAVFVERIFAWPGIGDLAVASIGGRDYFVVLGVTLIGSVVVVVAGILTDLAYAAVDPRTGHG